LTWEKPAEVCNSSRQVVFIFVQWKMGMGKVPQAGITLAVLPFKIQIFLGM
jgi:hypothetical protein